VASRTVTIGVVLLAVLGLFELAYAFVGDISGDQAAFGIVVGLGTLVALGLWASGRGPRVAMWVAVVLIGVTALSAVASFFVPGVPAGTHVVSAVFTVLAIAAIVLVRGELGRRRPEAGTGRRVA
jgi:peptidoglycan/LPS O-acetylase OafA/YrhL